MAKKSKKKGALTYCPLLLLIGSLLVIVSAFFPASTLKKTDWTFSGWNMAFGYKAGTGVGEVDYFAFSFMNLLPYILSLSALFIVLVNVGDKKPSATSYLIASVCLVVAGVLVLISIPLAQMHPLLKDGLELGYGAIIGGTTSLLLGGASATLLVLKK